MCLELPRCNVEHWRNHALENGKFGKVQQKNYSFQYFLELELK